MYQGLILQFGRARAIMSLKTGPVRYSTKKVTPFKGGKDKHGKRTYE